MAEIKKRGFVRRFVRLITFVDLPIRRKFTLFAVGVLFWFVVLAGVSSYILVDVNIKTSQVVSTLLPYEWFAQDALRKSSEMKYLLATLIDADSEHVVVVKVEEVKAKLEGINNELEQLLAPRALSPLSLILNRLYENNWLDVTGNENYVQGVETSVDALSQLLNKVLCLKMDQIKNGINNSAAIATAGRRLVDLDGELSAATVSFLVSLSQQAQRYSYSIATATSYAFWIMMTVLALASGLLAIFTFWISAAIVYPVTSMITKIHSLASGHVDLTDKIVIRSDDEIGAMSNEFNDLMDTVHGMTVFKSVIEEDANLEDVYSRMGEAFSANVGIENYRIYEVTSDYKGMKAVFPLAMCDEELSCEPDILVNCELCRAVKTGHTINSLEYDRVCKQFIPTQQQTHVCIPMIIGGHAGGVVQFIFDKQGDYALTRSEIEQKVAKAEAYIKQSLSVLEAKRLMNTLRESSLRDPMTGLFNRRFLQDQANHMIAGSLRRNKNIGLLMCDIDYFKQVNDKFGHDAGDVILKETSAIIASSVRESDVVVRFGGEEFLVILNDVEPGDSFAVAEKIRTNVENKVFISAGDKIRKTISLGVSEFPADSDGFWQAIKYADVAMYQAKETGRNKSVRFEPSMWSGDEF